MKNKGNTRSARTTAKKIHIRQGGRDLTAQTGLIQESSGSDHTEYLISLHTLGESTAKTHGALNSGMLIKPC